MIPDPEVIWKLMFAVCFVLFVVQSVRAELAAFDSGFHKSQSDFWERMYRKFSEKPKEGGGEC